MLRALLLLLVVALQAAPTDAETKFKPIQASKNAGDPEYVDARCRAFLFQAFMIGTIYRGHRNDPAGAESFEAFRFAQRIRNVKRLIGHGEPKSQWSVKNLSLQYSGAFGPLLFPENITSTQLFQQDRKTCALVIEHWTK